MARHWCHHLARLSYGHVSHGGQGVLWEEWVFHKVAGVESDTLALWSLSVYCDALQFTCVWLSGFMD